MNDENDVSQENINLLCKLNEKKFEMTKRKMFTM